MPNWCYNIVSVKDDSETIEVIVDLLKKPYETVSEKTELDKKNNEFNINKEIYIVNQPISFFNIVKPDDQDIEEYHSIANSVGLENPKNWYNWNIDNWGTKWDAIDVDFKMEKNQKGQEIAKYSFTTAWDPPVTALDKLSKMFPSANITLSYEQEGDYKGFYEWHNGKLLNHNHDILIEEYSCEEDTQE